MFSNEMKVVKQPTRSVSPRSKQASFSGSSLKSPGPGGSAPDIERYVRWPHANAHDRVKTLKLLWDALGSEFGSRHLQYEMFYAGEPASIQGREFRNFDWAAAEALVDRCLADYDDETV